MTNTDTTARPHIRSLSVGGRREEFRPGEVGYLLLELVETTQAERDRLASALEAVTVERDSLSALHEVATERTVQLAAVIEKAPHSESCMSERSYAVVGIALRCTCWKSQAATDAVLREHDAGVWSEGANAVEEQVDPKNPYRTEGGD